MAGDLVVDPIRTFEIAHQRLQVVPELVLVAAIRLGEQAASLLGI
jgi:hypothetical protein